MNDKLVCSDCGSDKVDYLAWVDANTQIFKEPFGPDGDSDNCWCRKCEEHTNLIFEKDFFQNQNALK